MPQRETEKEGNPWLPFEFRLHWCAKHFSRLPFPSKNGCGPRRWFPVGFSPQNWRLEGFWLNPSKSVSVAELARPKPGLWDVTDDFLPKPGCEAAWLSAG